MKLTAEIDRLASSITRAVAKVCGGVPPRPPRKIRVSGFTRGRTATGDTGMKYFIVAEFRKNTGK